MEIYIQENALNLTEWFQTAENNSFRIENRIVFKRNGDKLTLLLPSGLSFSLIYCIQYVFCANACLHVNDEALNLITVVFWIFSENYRNFVISFVSLILQE